jgi:hypothetical protein
MGHGALSRRFRLHSHSASLFSQGWIVAEGVRPASGPPSYACFIPKPDPIRPQPLPAVSTGWANTGASVRMR